jgi:hypothetical protein
MADRGCRRCSPLRMVVVVVDQDNHAMVTPMLHKSAEAAAAATSTAQLPRCLPLQGMAERCSVWPYGWWTTVDDDVILLGKSEFLIVG